MLESVPIGFAIERRAKVLVAIIGKVANRITVPAFEYLSTLVLFVHPAAPVYPPHPTR